MRSSLGQGRPGFLGCLDIEPQAPYFQSISARQSPLPEVRLHSLLGVAEA